MDDSPTAQLAPPSASQIKQELCQAMVPAAQPVQVPSAANPNVSVAISGSDASAVWPTYTNVVKLEGQVKLNEQSWELRLIIKKAMLLNEERARFENAFPSLVTRTVWNRCALVDACSTVANFSPASASAKEKYEMFKEQLRADVQYIEEISNLLDPRISGLRSNTKAIAVNNVRGAYGLCDGCGGQVQQLFTSSRYIYPPNANGTGFLFHKPFENISIIGTLHNDLFTGNTLVMKYPSRFNKDTEPNKLSPPMIALAATAVYAALKEWESGHRLPTHFTANLYESIYRTHINSLETIQALNKNGYDAMLQCLFRMASTVDDKGAELNLTDIQNMSTDVTGD